MGNPVTPELIAAIYEGALDPARWQATLARLCDAFHVRGCNMWTADMATGAADFSGADGQLAGSHGCSAAGVASYIAYYSMCDVWCARTARVAPGEATTGSELVPETQLLQTEWYADWLRQEDLFHAVGGCLARDGNHTRLFSMLRPRQAGDFDADEVTHFRQLLPHLQNAARLHRDLRQREQLAASAVEALETLEDGVLLFARNGQLLHATLRARQLLQQARGVRWGAGTVSFEGGAEAGALQAMLQAALRAGCGHGVAAGGSVMLHTAYGRLQCQVTPLPAGSGGLSGVAGAALFCSAPPAPAACLADSLRQRFHMTPAEAQLTQALVNGLSLKEHAALRDVSLNTVRSQLKGAVAKTGARRQADLVRIVLSEVLSEPASAAGCATPARH